MKMQTFPLELKEHIWQDLNIEDVLRLCETSQEYKQICDNPEVWYFYLRRDFGIVYQGYDPKTKYVMEYTKRKEREAIRKKKLFVISAYDERKGKIVPIFHIIAANKDEIANKLAMLYNAGQLEELAPKVYDEITFFIQDLLEEGKEVGPEFVSEMLDPEEAGVDILTAKEVNFYV